MRSVPVLVVLLGLAACTRPLSENEADFAGAVFGETLNTSEIGVAVSLGLGPPPGERPYVFKALNVPEAPCARAAPSPVTGAPAAFVSFNRLHYATRFYTADAMAGWPDKARMPHALLLAHELTHVWQWQNRDVTGYHPVRALLESIRTPDPYFYDIDAERPFLSHGYEQQAALVEDYVCHRLLDPGAPKLETLRQVLAPVFPLDRLEAVLAE